MLGRDGGVYYHRFAIALDGRIGTETIRCIQAAGAEQPTPAGPDAYRRAVEAALKDGATETVPDPIKVTDKTAIIPAPQNPASNEDHPIE